MSRSSLWLIPLAVLLLAGCNGPNGDKLGAVLGDGSDTLHRTLEREELAALPTLNEIDVDAPLTAADYDLFLDHAQAFGVNVVGARWLQADSDALNALFNRYKPNLGQMVDDLRSGAQTPEDFCRYAMATRTAVIGELDTVIPAGDAHDQFVEFRTWNDEFWTGVGYPAGPPEMALDAVQHIGLTGEQSAQLIEIGVKMLIRSGRVVNPTGTAYSGDGDPFHGQVYSDKEFIAIGNQSWDQMMNVFTPEQRKQAFRWWKGFDAKIEAYRREHWQPTPPQFDEQPAVESAAQ